MGIHGQLIKGLRATVRNLAGEKVVINGTEVPAIINEEERGIALGIGAMNTERTLVIQIETGAVQLDPKARNIIEARGQKWQISSEPNSVRTGGAATTITLVEPERRNEG